MTTNYGAATEAKVEEVMDACRSYGSNSIIALAGVPGTGKSFIANIAAQRLATDPLMVREIQFHPSYSYEEFIEGYRATPQGGFSPDLGVFLEWNELARADSPKTYVLLVEELTRANLPSVLGELLTYIEHRDRPFFTMYTRRAVQLAPNLTILATYNPRDRSALELDEAILRRMRIIHCPPDMDQLREMLTASSLPPMAIDRLRAMFDACSKSDDYETLMPFGHGMFAGVTKEKPELNRLWTQRILPMIRRPLLQPHPFADTITDNYPWSDPTFETAG
jgi:5-methylcytosine-specific restriction protein B